MKIDGIPSKASRLFAPFSHPQKHRPLRLTSPLLLFTLVLFATSCIFDDGDEQYVSNDTMTVELNLSTRSMSSDVEDYEMGSQWENYIDIAGGDYRIYFFTYNPSAPSDTETNNILISEFNPLEVTAVEGSVYTKYTLMGFVADEIAEYSDFKVVILANWGTYPTVVAGSTTIDDICKAENSKFDAFINSEGTAAMPSSTLHIPFYGVREYSGVEWKAGWRTILNGDITLLRAVAKVEVVLSTESDENVTFEDVSICGYNAEGYCAPTGVYIRSDYDSGYTDWARDFANTIHLVNTDAQGDEINDDNATERTMKLSKTEYSGTTRETWTCYLPEYSNAGSDYCYITAKFDYQALDEEPYRIYFGNYTNGTTSAYTGGSTDDRFDIYRNCLYRFTVSISGTVFRVIVNDWEGTHDNDFVFDRDPDYEDLEGEP